MIGHSNKIKKSESFIYLILWTIISIIPVFISQNDYGINWSRVFREWYRFLPFLFIFLIHNFYLFPKLFSTKSKALYFSLTILLIISISFLSVFLGKFLNHQPSAPMMPHPPQSPPPMGVGALPRSKPLIMFLLDNVIISFLVVGFNAAIKITIKWQDEERKNEELEKKKLQTELAFLRNQISPHFFMNTLNNIHALIDISSEDAKESVIKLSKLMRYLLYDSEQGNTKLSKEIEFIKSYVDLMKLRYSSKVSIKLFFPEFIPSIDIPPMLFTSIVENAFKHGISYQHESYIEIVLNVDEKYVYFRIKNSVHQNQHDQVEEGGLGLINLQKRLDLMYGKMYDLSTSESDTSFEIIVKIPLYAD